MAFAHLGIDRSGPFRYPGTPGARDGDCDACLLTGGESPENEIFLLLGSYSVDPSAVAGTAGAEGRAMNAGGRSLVSELLPPPVAACRGPHPTGTAVSGDPEVAHTGHAGHARRP
ncbi:MAG TPA: hypothetical protein VFD92_03220 [Candidatus Binatia bacterium]|nr:hypothetical protein [Candidatus Binatia bacterium]